MLDTYDYKEIERLISQRIIKTFSLKKDALKYKKEHNLKGYDIIQIRRVVFKKYIIGKIIDGGGSSTPHGGVNCNGIESECVIIPLVHLPKDEECANDNIIVGRYFKVKEF